MIDGVGSNKSNDSTNDKQGNNNPDTDGENKNNTQPMNETETGNNSKGPVEPEPTPKTENIPQNYNYRASYYVPPNYEYNFSDDNNLSSRGFMNNPGPIIPEIKDNSNYVNSNLNIDSTKRFDLEPNNFQTWTIINGNWSLETDTLKVLRQLDSEDNCYAYTGSPNWTNYTVQAQIKFEYFAGSDQPLGLIARFKDINNFYYVRISNSNILEVRKIVNGSIMSVASKTFHVQNNIWYSMKLKVFGNKLECYINDKLELSADDPLFTSGQAGILINNVNVEIKDFKITLLK